MNQIDQWKHKFNALPRLPRSQSKFGYVDTIKTIFHKIITNTELETVVKIEGSETEHTITQIYISHVIAKIQLNFL